MNIRNANINDLSAVSAIYVKAREFMSANGNAEQWGGGYPSDELIRSDIEREKLFLCMDGEMIAGVFYFSLENDPAYEKIYDGRWLNDRKNAVIHRVAVAVQGKGVVRFCFEYCFKICQNIKIDTHKNNIPMQRALEKNGFRLCGKIYLENGEERLAYQRSE